MHQEKKKKNLEHVKCKLINVKKKNVAAIIVKGKPGQH